MYHSIMQAKNSRCFRHKAININFRFAGVGLTFQIGDQFLLAGSYLFAFGDQQEIVKIWIEKNKERNPSRNWHCTGSVAPKFDCVASSIYQANKQCVEQKINS